ncbi:hypothetical protein MRX96_037476 [Rhipicephalus microplus]
MDTTAASRKRVREQNKEPTAAPDTSCLARYIAATSRTLATPLPTDRSSEGSAGTLPKARTATATAPAPRKKKPQARSSQWKQHHTSKTHTAEAPAASVLHSSPVTVPRPCPSPSHAEGDFITVISKAAQWRARALQAAAVVTDPAVVGTAFHRPSAPGGSFRGSPRMALAGLPGTMAVRVNYRRNIVAASPECLRKLLTIAELHGSPVTAREPADRRVSTGFVCGVDGDLNNTELLRGIASAAPVTAATREGGTVKLPFASPSPPDRITTFGLQLRVASASLPRHAIAPVTACAAATDTRNPTV